MTDVRIVRVQLKRFDVALKGYGDSRGNRKGNYKPEPTICYQIVQADLRRSMREGLWVSEVHAASRCREKGWTVIATPAAPAQPVPLAKRPGAFSYAATGLPNPTRLEAA